MEHLEPESAREVADLLQRGRRTIIAGAGTKTRMGGPVDADAETTLLTTRLDSLLRYEPRDLTVSVGAGMRFADLSRVLSENKQMLPLDPAFASDATIGGIIATNSSGPRRRLYGTARDQVIGMTFATLDGRVVDTGGMVVKNVAGLDMGKLMIGSFGTLAVVTSVNFKVHPLPAAERTIAMEFEDGARALAVRDRWLSGVLQPGAIDLLEPHIARELGLNGWTLLLWFGGNEALMDRCASEASAMGPARACPATIWEGVRDAAPRFLKRFPQGAIVRVSSLLSKIGAVLDLCLTRTISRAGTGVTYAFYENVLAAIEHISRLRAAGFRAVIEFGPVDRTGLELWPDPGSDFAIMEKVKALFDPSSLLNRGRLFGRL